MFNCRRGGGCATFAMNQSYDCQIHLTRLYRIYCRKIFESVTADDAGVVDQHVNLAGLGENLRDDLGGFPLPAGAEVGVVGDERAARCFDCRARLCEVAARDADDRCAFLRERDADCLTNAPACTGDDDYFIFETFHIVKITTHFPPTLPSP